MGSKFKKKGQSQIMKKSTSTLLIAMLILGIAGCSEGGEINPTDSGKTAEVSTTATTAVEEKTTATTKEQTEQTAKTEPVKTAKTAETSAQIETAKTIVAEKPIETAKTIATEKPVETAVIKPQDLPPAVWKEVPVEEPPTKDGNYLFLLANRGEFDLKKAITQEDNSLDVFSFKGTVIGVKEYETTWTDYVGDNWGPFTRTVLEIKIDKVYIGKSPESGNIIKAITSFPISCIFEDSVRYKEGAEYVFINSEILDEKYTDWNVKYNPVCINDGIAEHADVSVGSNLRYVFPVENGQVITHPGYFNHDEQVMRKAISNDSVKTNALFNGSQTLENKYFTALTLSDFETAFLKLFENPEKLPTIENNR